MISSAELYFLILPSKSKQTMLLVLILVESLKNSWNPCFSAFSISFSDIVMTKWTFMLLWYSL